MAPEFKPASRWQFFCEFRKEWINCTQEEDQSIKDAFLQCSEEAPIHIYTLNHLKMKVDFSRMVRINLASERSLELKLVGGQLPFAPPGPAAQKVRYRKKKKATEDVPEKEETKTKAVKDVAETKEETALAKKTDLAEEGELLFGEEPTQMKDVDKFDFVPTMSNEFEFTIEFEDREDWGKIFIYKMYEAGISHLEMDTRYIQLRDKRGRTAGRTREDMEGMLEAARSYPVTVIYKPPDVMNPESWKIPAERPEWELQSLLMYFIKQTIVGEGCVESVNEIKYYHHKCAFERYQLYVHEEDMWLTDCPMTEKEFFNKFPLLGPHVTLALKVGPRLRDIFRGKEEILNMLFGF